MTDVVPASEAYTKLEISGIEPARSKHNAADAFTKVNKCLALERLLSDEKSDHPIEDWVLYQDVTRSRDLEDGEFRSNSLAIAREGIGDGQMMPAGCW